MYILYCACTSEKLSKSFNIAAVLTKGDTDGLREGKNAVFYDRDGNDYTAKVTSIVDNPISVWQAFWSPYKKVGRWISDKVDKSASEKNDKSLTNLTAKADTAEVLETKAEEAPVDSAALAQSEADKKAAEEAAKAQASAPSESTASAKSSIMENPWEFLIVSAAFIASVLVIIFTGDD